MSNNLATAFLTVPNQKRIVLSGQDIHSHCRLKTMLFQRIKEAKESDPVAVFPVRPTGNIRKGTGAIAPRESRILESPLGRLPFHMLQVDNDTHRNPGIFRPP